MTDQQTVTTNEGPIFVTPSGRGVSLSLFTDNAHLTVWLIPGEVKALVAALTGALPKDTPS